MLFLYGSRSVCLTGMSWCCLWHGRYVVYDEVHTLDGEEGAALQRIIRAVSRHTTQ